VNTAPTLSAFSVPRPTAIFVGRDRELGRIRAAHADVPVAVIHGVAGVGKSSLALAYAATWPGRVAYLNARADQTLLSIADAIHRAPSQTRGEAPTDDRARLIAAWASLDRGGCLVIIDDLHLLPLGSQRLLIGTASELREARLVVASRELIPVSPTGPDHLQLRLEPLDRTSARSLWERLVELYGQSCDFETAWRRSLGSPFLLRQAILAPLAPQHPFESTVRDLRPEEYRLASVLAMAHSPLPRDVVTRIPLADVLPSLYTLVTRLVVDITSEGTYQMGALWRDVVKRGLDGEARRAAAAALVVALSSSDLDPLAKVRETASHLRYLDRHDEIGPLLLTYSAELVRKGAGAALLRELDELPASSLTAELVVLRTRTLARGMQIARAYHELCGFVEAGHRAWQVRMLLGATATATGELDHGHRVLKELADDPALEPALRRTASLELAWNHAGRGAMAQARQELAGVDGELPPARTLPLRLFMLMHEGEQRRAADLAAHWLRSVRDIPEDLWSRQLTPVLCAAALATVGRFAEAGQVAQRMERCLRWPAESLELGWIHMFIRYHQGERGGALAYLSEASGKLDRGGHLPGTMWTRASLCRLLFLHGRRRRALALLAELKDTCRRCGTSAYDRLIAAATAEDVLSPDWIARVHEPPAGNAGDAIRARVRTALRRACSRGLDDEPPPALEIPASPDYGLDRALLELAHAHLARRRGQSRIEALHLRRAAASAAEADADGDLIPRLQDILLGLAELPAARGDTGSPDRHLEIDGIRHELRLGTHRILLGTRPVTRQLLYAFAGAPSNYLTRAAVARSLWRVDYDPIRHDSTMKSNIRRLRTLLAGLAEIRSEAGGYHLLLPSGTTFIPPACLHGATTPCAATAPG
jgi:hypothetical protein